MQTILKIFSVMPKNSFIEVEAHQILGLHTELEIRRFENRPTASESRLLLHRDLLQRLHNTPM